MKNKLPSQEKNQLRKLGSLRDSLEENNVNEMVRVLVFSRSDYCNSLYVGLSRYLLEKLRRIKNLSARCIYKLNCRVSTSSYHRELHWLPVKSWVEFKNLLHAHNVTHHSNQTPLYINELLERSIKVTGIQYAYNFTPPHARTALGRRSFSYTAAVE